MAQSILFQSKGAPEYRFLSNFWLAPMVIDGHKYATVEHYYQSCKTIDPEEKERIRAQSNPAAARKLGQKVTLIANWDDVKELAMFVGLSHKFRQNPDIAARLLATHDAELIEYAPWGDTYWGVDKDLKGENRLGRLLMVVRDMLCRETHVHVGEGACHYCGDANCTWLVRPLDGGK